MKGQRHGLAVAMSAVGLAMGATGEAWAAPADARCADGGHLDLYRQSGTAFAREQACHAYASAGHELVHLAVEVHNVWFDVKGANMETTDSGFGLLPGSSVESCGTYFDAPEQCRTTGTVAPDGTHSSVNEVYLDYEQGTLVHPPGTYHCFYRVGTGYLTGIYLVGTTASGRPVRSRTVTEGVATNCG